ncbi:hypothetical protein JCM24511_00772 [Saitozyma sp. JCM 24511]|nr:hypothetical protein JCM24511_00772 [Saitozyma sp. JCM 24511]
MPTGGTNRPFWVKSFRVRQAIGHPSNKVQALTDILNALGWNSGLRSPTKSLAANAWWHMATTAVPTLFNILSEIYQTDDQIRALFQLARANSTGDGLPCQNHPTDQHHRYQVNNGQPFRIRSCMHGCYHKLQRAAVIHWKAELVNYNVVDGSKLGLDGL